MAPSILTASLQLLALAALAASSPCVKTCPPDVKDRLVTETTNGRVIGHVAPNTSCVVEYLGIPYAKPPVGQLRFAAPEKLVGPPSTYEAANYGFDCPSVPSGPPTFPDLTPQAPRIVSYFAGASGTPQSEDCLTLNVWSRPSAKPAAAKKPILVFFHGGRFAIGNTNSPMYTGKYLAEAEDLVVVTVTYRLNIFGFPGAPGLDAQNLGIRDQRAAVEWVRDNAAAFGGDASRITISGQSSGGVAVDYWTYAYDEDPIAHAIIATSGNAFSFPVNAVGIPERNWNTVVEAVGCGADADQLACMRRANWTAINAAAGAVRPSASSSVLRSVPPFYPIPDDKIVFRDYVSLTAAGAYAPIPVLMGHNHNEDGYYRLPVYRNGVIPTPAQVASFLLESFTCPVSYQSRARAASGVPAFAYRFLADWDNTRLFPTSGAYHGVDLHMVFGASEDTSGLPASTDQKRLTRMMQRMWSSFSADPKQGLTRALGWPVFDADKKTLAVLGRDNAPGVSYVKPSEFDAPCSTVVMGALSTAA
ncbi:hypothetical protein MCOR25_008409 [Pyricularia grisea]|uniref:Carboxylic ester hydrolase n=1 Tax=Pyricularia grisea TaxID=148305 RepID=A0A6P8AXR0_PYRGI|nr:hypothetical protein PgNI_11058 [Pyricularia grisea]KAI6354923.1 hypothetical protein MCOR25_008409 [Pyricularia grisea]TLD07071.1 hypothetical protein PgNI_11058 [Pyricularia grisea]